ncbi:MAG TPA: hypothetical protein VFI13_06480, partial [Gemmatimonadales bacterium]|nr:hypothetical protein [Gemmatimonadales bacterium]
GLGLGVASAKVSCTACGSVDRETFPMFDVRLGGTLSRSVTLGVQVAGGAKDGAFGDPSSVRHTVGDLNVSAYWYPKAEGDLWLQGGISGVVWQGKQGSTTLHSTAGGLTAGIGYDLRVGHRNLSISPSIRGTWGGEAKVIDQDGNKADLKWKTSFVMLNVAVLWH